MGLGSVRCYVSGTVWYKAEQAKNDVEFSSKVIRDETKLFGAEHDGRRTCDDGTKWRRVWERVFMGGTRIFTK